MKFIENLDTVEYDYIVYPKDGLNPENEYTRHPEKEQGTMRIIDKIATVECTAGPQYFRNGIMDWIDFDMKYNENKSKIVFVYEPLYEDAIREFEKEFHRLELGEVFLYAVRS